ncbi:MAG: tRNA preQ1(34) S-adenosylmethionine ribosyltransferase-isomerase QueA [Candidatus Magasanikbacteria bacterium CG11_big_fil_rev_8_21_14_0_20_39_34]|uniref:S-adenosylmethionine:tRNA ribosyltransferase-isomerase n=1 Tax=Candidatus Magasanikbacteria bacterium CG11_big_fil_rev_8_21_14_0_20_39_34 TaxID=1974653 RepID=A0A2H0N5Y2_9BACT|nr:MAG: tRNA preQ1(34) S-adenosylmethionine ribosyltransferase-isomerase QueA [Candidatus Magasanikbacteria bacterium CG11_big_fil_rev_8_21_14_0_20_39_34]
MYTSDFDYNLPTELIAQKSVDPRDHSKMMVVNHGTESIEHKHFFDIVDYLQKGDLIVWNTSKVFKARLFGKLMAQNGENLWEHKRKIELFLVRPMENDGVWKVLAKPGKHVKNGMRIVLSCSCEDVSDCSCNNEDFFCDVLVKEKEGTILVQFPDTEEAVRKKANRYGHIPIPPYVKDEPHQLELYQTAYAQQEGSVAAPTAGFHFTDALIEKLTKKGVEFAEVSLHVGLGTFLPVKTERVKDHTMHAEIVELTKENAEKINRAKREGRRVIAVGTTTVRTLEGIAMLRDLCPTQTPMQVHAYHGDINIFITPGFEFQIVDAMITNFHLPKSTLLMLVCAFSKSQALMMECYREAVAQKYRFYSFGDAMFIV